MKMNMSVSMNEELELFRENVRRFIAAEVIAFRDYVWSGGEQGAKAKGKMRLEGREYVVQDGDVILFRFNV